MTIRLLTSGTLMIFLWGTATHVLGVSPMVEFNDLVAGEGEADYRDGAFTSAMFNQPTGLAIDPGGTQLFVADTTNNRIRVILLDQNNLVQTVAGNGAATLKDGPLGQASFNNPQWLTFADPTHLFVYDFGDKHIRYVDLASKIVTTPNITNPSGAKGLGYDYVEGLVFHGKENALYFTQGPPWSALQRLDLNTFICSPQSMTAPASFTVGTLCDFQGKICVADRDTGEVYQVEPGSNTLSASVSLADIGKGDGLSTMAAMGATLYGIPSKSNTTWMQIAPAQGAGPLSLLEIWGDTVSDEQVPALSDLFSLDTRYLPAGFVADPRDDKRFYFSRPNKNIILSLRDYRFDAWKVNIPGGSDGCNINGISDYDYPLKKPPHTFRILISGASLSYQMIEENIPRPWNWENRMEILPKKLELVLNTLSSLMGSNVHFQVLHQGHPDIGDGLTWANYHVPDVVKKFDIDLCIKQVNPALLEFWIYYNRPLTKEGIPTENPDPNYSLKSFKERASVSPITEDLFERALKANLADMKNNNVFQDMPYLFKNKDIRNDLMELEGRPYELLSQKVQSMKTSAGVPVGFELCFLPVGNLGSMGEMPNGPYRDFWKEVCAKKGIPFMDLTDSSNALKFTYYDTEQFHYAYHYNHKGQLLNAILLASELIHQKLIPLEFPTSIK